MGHKSTNDVIVTAPFSKQMGRGQQPPRPQLWYLQSKEQVLVEWCDATTTIIFTHGAIHKDVRTYKQSWVYSRVAHIQFRVYSGVEYNHVYTTQMSRIYEWILNICY